MNVITTDIESVKLIQPKVFSDDRGYFLETWNRKIFEDAGLDIQFVQDNESQSSKGTLRGIHFQLQHPQGKLVRAALGEVYDIAVDLRRDSPTFGHSVGAILSAENKHQLWIPPGFGHAYYTMSDIAVFVYKCTDFYYPDDQYCLKWDDPALDIRWPIEEGVETLLSEQDKNGKMLAELEGIL